MLKALYCSTLTLLIFFFSYTESLSHESELLIADDKGKVRFVVEVAETSDDLAKGLMFRKNLDDDKGMLFIFESPKIVGMWMKNTLLPLDMIFIEENGSILKIAENTTPESMEVISSEVPVRAVLEINGGMSDLLGINVGDTVYHDVLREFKK